MTGSDIRVVAHLTTIPISLLLIAWVGLGRTALLPDGATEVPMTLTVIAPALVVLLGITSALAIRQCRPDDGYLTVAQLSAALCCWLTLAGFGFVLVDSGLAGSASPFTQLAGARFVPLSDALTVACLYGFVAGDIGLLLLLLSGLDGARQRRAARIPLPARVDASVCGMAGSPSRRG